MEDPTASNWTHWVLFDVPAGTSSLATGSSGVGVLGAEQLGAARYAGPCPPSGNHTYVFTLQALDVATIGLSAGATKTQVRAALTGHVLGTATLSGTVASSDL